MASRAAVAGVSLLLILSSAPLTSRFPALDGTVAAAKRLMGPSQTFLESEVLTPAGTCAALHYPHWQFSFGCTPAVTAADPAPQHMSWYAQYLAASTPSGEISEAALGQYRALFAAQADADWARADTMIENLSDLRLLGTALAMRYLDSRYTATFAELSDWLRLFRDQPQAGAVYELARQKAPSGDTMILVPANANLTDAADDVVAADFTTLGRQFGKSLPPPAEARATREARILLHGISADIHRGRPSQALDLLAAGEDKLTPAGKAYAHAAIAAAYFYDGNIADARDEAAEAIAADAQAVPFAYWIAGLVAWHDKDYAAASEYFVQLTKSQGVGRDDMAAADFWAGRALAQIDPNDPAAAEFFRRAANYQETLYGLLAAAMEGQRPVDHDDSQTLTDEQRAMIADLPAGARALGLIALDEPTLATAELQSLTHRNAKLKAAVLTLAAQEGLDGFGSEDNDGQLAGYHVAAYPIPRWKPQNGFTTDPALIYALARQESHFDPSAESSRGALGLMQLMPETARHMINQNWRGATLSRHLTDPVFNMTVGQNYLHRLSREAGVDGNLLYMIAAYNWGNAKLTRWLDDTGDGQDPLLMMESIPVRETRDFVSSVLTGYGVYRLRMGQDLAPLATLAKGGWPKFDTLATTAAGSPRSSWTERLFTRREQ